jgi:hypothetical protein
MADLDASVDLLVEPSTSADAIVDVVLTWPGYSWETGQRTNPTGAYSNQDDFKIDGDPQVLLFTGDNRAESAVSVENSAGTYVDPPGYWDDQFYIGTALPGASGGIDLRSDGIYLTKDVNLDLEAMLVPEGGIELRAGDILGSFDRNLWNGENDAGLGVPGQVALRTSNITLLIGAPPPDTTRPQEGPVYSVTTERIYHRLPEMYRVLDAQNNWHFKKFISSIGDQLNEIDVLNARLEFIPPEVRHQVYESLNFYNTYTRPEGIEDPDRGFAPIGETSDLLDGRTADAGWLKYIAQILGLPVKNLISETDLRNATTINLGYNAGSLSALETAVKAVLTGTKWVEIKAHYDGSGGDPYNVGGAWDVLIMTKFDETPFTSSELVAEIVRRRAKPAGVNLTHLFDGAQSGGLRPRLQHTSYGQFTIANYNEDYDYFVDGAGIELIGRVLYMQYPNSIGTIYADDGINTSEIVTFERKAYTSHGEEQGYYTDNCVPGIDCIANPFPGCTQCGGDGYVSGTDCCGGSHGQTYHPNTVLVRDPKPSGYYDSFSEWWRLEIDTIPTLTHTDFATFTITNYDPTLTYYANGGTITDDTLVLTALTATVWGMDGLARTRIATVNWDITDVVATPIMAHTGQGQFTVTNYDPTFTYHTSVGIVTGNVVTLTSPTATATVWGTRGPATTASATIARLPFSYTPDTRYSYTYDCSYWSGGGCTHSFPVSNGNCGPGNCNNLGAGWSCENPNWCCDVHEAATFHQQTCTGYGGSAPQLINEPGWTNGGTEWFKAY